MLDRDRQAGETPSGEGEPGVSEAPAVHRPGPRPDTEMRADLADDAGEPDESIVEEIGNLIDDAGNYAQAEIAFQKSRAKFAGRTVGVALLQVVLAIILLHIAFLALAVGLVIALTPVVTVWGAIAIVFGGLLVIVAILLLMAKRRGQQLGALFSSEQDPEDI